MTSFAEWMKLEKCWMASYRRKMLKTTVFVTLPLTALVLGGLMAVTGLMYDGFLPETAGLFLTGAGAGAFRPEQEYKTATTVRAKSSTVTGFTLYTICFYSREQVAAGLAADTPADAAMGFFSEELRDRASAMIGAQGEGVQYVS